MQWRYCVEKKSCWVSKTKREKKKQGKYSMQLKFTRSFPAQGLSKLNKTTQAATYQTAACQDIFISPSCLWVWQREREQSSAASNIRTTSSMQNRLRLFVIENFIGNGGYSLRKDSVWYQHSSDWVMYCLDHLFPAHLCLFYLLSHWFITPHWERCVEG